MNNIQTEIQTVVEAVKQNKFSAMMQEDSFLRIQSVINSCVNEEHLQCCEMMIENFKIREGNKILLSVLRKEMEKVKSRLNGKS